MILSAKKILITGGARRVGAVISRMLASRGAVLTIHCLNGREEGEKLLQELPGNGHTLVTADLSLPGAAAELYEQYGPFDALVNNASIYSRTPASLNEEESRHYFEVNFWSPLALMRAFAAHEHPGGGAVVNVVDQEVLRYAPECGIYAVTRRALTDAALGFALEYAGKNLRFNAVAPGPMMPPPGMEHSTMSRVLTGVPLGRKVAPEDLAAAVVFALENDSMTGAVIPVDGGQHLKNYVLPGN